MLSPSLILAVILPIVGTFIGGQLVLRTKQNIRPWLSLSGGILLGLAFLDLLPEAFEHGTGVGLDFSTMGAVILGSILLFHFLDKFFDFHGHEGHEHHCENEQHTKRDLHIWSKIGGLGFHSFLDGLAIGGGFAASARLGLLVTLAVTLHKFTDGMSTITILHSKGRHPSSRTSNIALLTMIALPLLGLGAGHLFTPSLLAQCIFLAFLAGLFIHLPLSELLPEAHEGKTSRLSLFLTLIGVGIMLFIKQFVD